MKMLFQQRMFSLLDSYDIYDEQENTLYTVEGQLTWGHCLKIFDRENNEVGTVKQCLFELQPRFEIWREGACVGSIQREFSPLKPKYSIDFNGWRIEGDWWEKDYTILGSDGELVASISKEPFHWTDTYAIDVERDENALCALMFVLAIDAEKCSRG